MKKLNKTDQKEVVRGGLGGWVACTKTTRTTRVDANGNVTALVRVTVPAYAVERWREQYPEQTSEAKRRAAKKLARVQPTEAA